MSEKKPYQLLFDECVIIAQDALKSKGHTHLNAKVQVTNIFSHSTTNNEFSGVIRSDNKRIYSVLKEQIKYICELGLDTAKGRKLVYVLTRNVNVGTRDNPIWLTMPDIQDSYHALIHVLVRAGALKNITVIHTYANYAIDYTGSISDIPVVKSWETAPDERGAYTGLFVVLTMPNGEILTSYYHAADIYSTHRQHAKTKKVWDKHNNAMCAKSAILEAVKYIPVFDEHISAVVEHYDESMDYDSEPKKADQWSEEELQELKEKGAGALVINKMETEDKPILPQYPSENFNNNIAKWHRLIENKIKTPEQIINTVCSTFSLTKNQINQIKGEVKNVVTNG